jgi:glycosyltransferase involved in cell wall biosynthesis
MRTAVRTFSPDLVVEDRMTDPRWLRLGRPKARWVMMHDPAPHDARHARKGLRQRSIEAQLGMVDGILAFSRSSQQQLQARFPELPVAATPLLSEMADSLRRPGSGTRSGFITMGRVSHYKGFDLAVRGWQNLTEGQREAHPLRVIASTGDPEILAWLADQPGLDLRTGRFDFEDVSHELSSSLGMLLPYRAGSQSGVQLLALQHGMVPVVSAIPGLTEYQPPGHPGVDDLDPEAWAAVMSGLLGLPQPGTAEDMRRHYDDVTSDDQVLRGWSQLLASAE